MTWGIYNDDIITVPAILSVSEPTLVVLGWCQFVTHIVIMVHANSV